MRHSIRQGGGSGDDNDWGGSIDIASFAKRINYIAKSVSGGKTPEANKDYVSANFKANLGYYNKGFNWDDTYKYGQYVALKKGTYLPLNIDLKKATISGDYTGTMGSYYTSGKNTSEPILSTNTGYMVGKGTQTAYCTPRFYNRSFTSEESTTSNYGIQYSINVTDRQGTITSNDSDSDGIYDIFSPSNISFFYYDTISDKTYRISDSENSNTWSTKITSNSIKVEKCGFNDIESGYYSVKKQFSKMLSDGNTSTILDSGAININGIQFFKDSNTSETSEEDTGSTDTIINGTSYSSFELLKGGLNFELKNNGSIKIVVGTCTNDATQIFPPLYEVFRSEDKTTIESKKQISAVYQSSDGKTYYHQYTDSTATIPSDSTKIFDVNKIVNNAMLKQKCAYYIEIPLNAGDYWFGPCKTTNCSYMLYLDIGANAGGGESGTAVQRTKIYEVLEQINEAFTYPTGISIVSFDNAVLDTKTLCVTLGSTYSGSASIKRTSETAADIVITASNSTGLAYYDPAITVTNDSKTYDSDIISESITTTQTRRLTYLDYYKEDKIINMFAFEQTAEITTSSTANWGDISMKQYTTEKESTEFTSTQNLTIHNDDGESVELSSITIDDQDSYGYSTVFSLNLNELKPSDFSIDYVPTGSIDTDSNKFTVSGYKVTMSDVAYTLTSKNENYSLIINDVTK